MMNKNRKNFFIIGILLTLIMGISISYAFFFYNKKGEEIALNSGDINISFTEGTNLINLGNTYPKSDALGMIDTTYYDFVIEGQRGLNDNIRYEIQIEEEEGNTLDEKYVKVYLTNQEDSGIISPTVINDLELSKHNDNRVVYEDLIWSGNEVFNYRLRVWVDSSYTDNASKTFSFKIKLYAYNEDVGKFLYDVAEETLKDNLLEDDGDARIVSGHKTYIDNNYVWYSGKLWRIVALNNDGSVKIITDENITTISWGENTTYEGSWIYQWLNEDFKDTLYNYDKLLVNDYKWNATMSTNDEKPLETTMVEATVGLLNYYEYQKITNANFNNGYLNIGYAWCLMTTYDSQNIWYVNESGSPYSNRDFENAFGVRPSIV